MTTSLSLIAFAILGQVFALSGIGKLRAPREFISGVREYRILPEKMVAPSCAAILLLELVVAAAHLLNVQLARGIGAGVLLLAAFAFAIESALRRGIVVKCMCFGTRAEEWISRKSLWRIVALLAVELGCAASLALGYQTHTRTPAELLQTHICAASLLVLGSWIFKIPDLQSIWESCMSCRRQGRRVSE